MPQFRVTNGARVLTILAPCRSCARRVAVEHVAPHEPTTPWRDPEVTKVELAGPDPRQGTKVLLDEGC